MATILNLPEPEYPKVGEPLMTSVMRPKGGVEILYLSHIIISPTEGKFIALAFDSEPNALEYAAEYVRTLRMNWRSLGKI